MKLLTIGFLTVLANSAYASENQRLKGVLINGSGCPQDGESVEAHWDRNTLVLNFAQLVARKGEGASLIESRVACTITLNLTVPPGYRYAAGAYVSSGSQSLGEGDQSIFSVSNFLEGQSSSAQHSDESNGLAEGRFHASYIFKPEERVWSSCESPRAVVLTASLRVSGTDRKTPSYASVDNLRIPFVVSRCPAQ